MFIEFTLTFIRVFLFRIFTNLRWIQIVLLRLLEVVKQFFKNFFLVKYEGVLFWILSVRQWEIDPIDHSIQEIPLKITMF